MKVSYPSRLPHTLPLKSGLKWRGKLKVERRQDGGYLVAFDAEAPNAHPNERQVYDVTVLSPKQLEDWTGWSETKS